MGILVRAAEAAETAVSSTKNLAVAVPSMVTKVGPAVKKETVIKIQTAPLNHNVRKANRQALKAYRAHQKTKLASEHKLVKRMAENQYNKEA